MLLKCFLFLFLVISQICYILFLNTNTQNGNMSFWLKRFENPHIDRIKQFRIAEYLGCYLDANLSGKSIAMKSLKKVNAKLHFLFRQNESLNPNLRRLLYNSLIKLHFDYAWVFWYPLVNNKIRKKAQVTQNKCICFC